LLIQDRYRVVAPMKKRPYTVIYEVKDYANDERGIPKILKLLNIFSENIEDIEGKLVELFQREANALQKLNHPSIPKGDGYFRFQTNSDFQPLHCLVMEKIPGMNLQDYIIQQQQLIHQELAVAWLFKLVSILDEVHDNEIIHRDIKPSNIMLRNDDKLALIDFGAVKILTENYIEDFEEQQITRICSTGYTAPEQLRGQSVFQSDFFSIGRTFVYLLTGKEPSRLDRYPNWQPEVQISQELKNFIDYLMHESPEKRPQNTKAILQELAAIQDSLNPPVDTQQQKSKIAPAPAGTTVVSSAKSSNFQTQNFIQQPQRLLNSGQDLLKEISIKTIATVAGIIVLVSVGGIGIYKWSSSCPAGQQKVNGIFCVTLEQNNNIISRGERTLFSTSHNPYRNQGITAFKQGNYKQAVNYFAQAVQNDSNDPEVLIYYNNALARQQGSPFTFAVVVPVKNIESVAQEILRGVAFAQNRFNANGGFNGHLLEIVIANDADDIEQAKKVAQQLVNDKDVLAVIGHYTSQVTGQALYKYQDAKEELAIISPTSSSSLLQSNIFFRTTVSNAKYGQQLAEYTRKNLNLEKVVVFYNRDSLFSNNLREEFTNKFEKLDGQVVSIIDLTEQKLNVDQKLNESVSKYQAQAVLLFPEPRYNPMALEIAKAKAKSNKPEVRNLKLLGASSLYSQQILKDGGNAIEGLILSIPWFRQAPQSKNFAQEASKQWGGREISWRTASSYDATQALIQALSFTPSRATVLQKLRQVNLLPQQTSGDKLQFIEGEINIQPILIKVEGGKFKQLTQ
jgi:ABC-type branched-subunit amino acid transport system substrate-binding protein